MIKFEDFTLIIENLKKVKNFVNNNITIEPEDAFIVELIYKELNKGVIKLGKPIYVTWLFFLYLKEKETIKDYKKHKWFLDLNKLITNLEIYQRNISKIPKNLHLQFVNKKGEDPYFNYLSVNDFILMVNKKVEESTSSKIMNDNFFVDKIEAEVILDNKNVKVIQILSQAAADFYGQESNWCTISSKGGAFSRYESDIFIVFDKKLLETKNPSRIIQINFNTTEVMDLNDKFDFSILKEKSINKLFKKEIEKIETVYIESESEDRAIKKIKSLDALTNLKYLFLKELDIKKLPEELFLNINLRELSLNKLPNIKTISEKIENLKELRDLEVYSTPNLTVLPKSLGKLSKLKGLTFSETNIKEIPFSFKNLTSLIGLSINNSKLEEVPKGLSLLPEISEISLYNNKIKSLPSEIKDMSILLDRFDLSMNNIDTIDPNLMKEINFSLILYDNPIEIRKTFNELLKENKGVIYEDDNIKIFHNIKIPHNVLHDYLIQINEKINLKLDLYTAVMVINKNLDYKSLPVFLHFDYENNFFIDEINVKYALNPVIIKELKKYFDVFSKDALSKIRINNCKIDSKLIENFIDVKELILTQCKIDSPKSLEKFRELELLGIIDMKTNQDDTISFSNFKKLKILYISKTKLGDNLEIKNNNLKSINIEDIKDKINLKIESSSLTNLKLIGIDNLMGCILEAPNLKKMVLRLNFFIDTLSNLKSSLKGFNNLKNLNSQNSYITLTVSNKLSSKSDFNDKLEDFIETLKSQLDNHEIKVTSILNGNI